MPLVGAEVQRVGSAFEQISLELAAVLTMLADVDFDTIGTPACDATVAAGMTDLRAALTHIEGSASSCVQVMSRHGVTLTSAADTQVGPHEA